MTSVIRKTAFVALSLAGMAVCAQEPEVGSLLVASGSLDDPNYERTVLFLVHHGEDGSIAVALNRPTWVAPLEAFPDADSLEGYLGDVFFGGPISPEQPLVVFERGSRMPLNSRHVIGSIYVSADLAVLDDIALTVGGSPRVRLFAGHSAWVPGQLANEIASGSWRVVPANAEQIFAQDPSSLWETVPLSSGAATAASFRLPF